MHDSTRIGQGKLKFVEGAVFHDYPDRYIQGNNMIPKIIICSTIGDQSQFQTTDFQQICSTRVEYSLRLNKKIQLETRDDYALCSSGLAD